VVLIPLPLVDGACVAGASSLADADFAVAAGII
jgi:hypothetical protein